MFEISLNYHFFQLIFKSFNFKGVKGGNPCFTLLLELGYIPLVCRTGLQFRLKNWRYLRINVFLNSFRVEKGGNPCSTLLIEIRLNNISLQERTSVQIQDIWELASLALISRLWRAEIHTLLIEIRPSYYFSAWVDSSSNWRY